MERTAERPGTGDAEEGAPRGRRPTGISPRTDEDEDDSAGRADAAAAGQGEEQRDDRGRRANGPTAISPKGWWEIARRVSAQIVDQNVIILSAGIAFFAMLALFPALGAIVTTYALIADAGHVAENFATFSAILPPDVTSIVDRRLQKLAGEQQGLGLGLAFGLLFSVWSARRSVDALVRTVTVAYDERETRGLVHLVAVTSLLTLGAIVLLVITVALLVALPAALAWMPLSGVLSFAAHAGGWTLLFAVLVFALGVLYRYGPPRRSAQVRWLSPGTVVAALLWLLGSAAFSLYVRTSGNTFSEIYGTLGAIIVLLLWFFLSAFSIVLGALLNAEMERQTKRDTTVGDPRPMGERGAFVADTVGGAR